MSGPSSVDSSSPFFASIASQAAVNSGAARANDRKKEKVGVRRFDSIVRDELRESDPGMSVRSGSDTRSPEKVLESLLDDVHAAGDVLKEKQVPATIVAYKNAVRAFVRYVVDEAFDVTESTSGRNILKRKKYTQVQVIDQKLEQMAAGILSNQKSQLDLLGKIDEINGLLVDLVS
jgi:hypothetical protein